MKLGILTLKQVFMETQKRDMARFQFKDYIHRIFLVSQGSEPVFCYYD